VLLVSRREELALVLFIFPWVGVKFANTPRQIGGPGTNEISRTLLTNRKPATLTRFMLSAILSQSSLALTKKIYNYLFLKQKVVLNNLYPGLLVHVNKSPIHFVRQSLCTSNNE
jgi:hypothetical protein